MKKKKPDMRLNTLSKATDNSNLTCAVVRTAGELAWAWYLGVHPVGATVDAQWEDGFVDYADRLPDETPLGLLQLTSLAVAGSEAERIVLGTCREDPIEDEVVLELLEQASGGSADASSDGAALVELADELRSSVRRRLTAVDLRACLLSVAQALAADLSLAHDVLQARLARHLQSGQHREDQFFHGLLERLPQGDRPPE